MPFNIPLPFLRNGRRRQLPPLHLACLGAALSLLATLYAFPGALHAWFQQDDFAHLLVASQTPIQKLPRLLILPFAQGTFRPLSERLFYWSGYHLAGLNNIPFRIVTYSTLLLASGLLILIARRLTGSSCAAILAALIWVTNPCLTLPITWTATTNQLLWSACALGAIYGFIRYCDTGRQRLLYLSWTAYLLGFGMLEANVAVPLVLAAYAALYTRRRLPAALLYALPAAVFALLHLTLIPRTNSPV